MSSTLVEQTHKLPRQEWRRPWGVLQAWTCASGYRISRAQVREPSPYVVGYGDLHYGSPQSDMTLAGEIRDWIKRTGALWIGTGDLIECAHRESVGAGVYEQIRTPDEQIDEIVPFLRPIAGQCLGLIKGNHEERAHKLCGIDPMAIIARELDVPYMGWEFWGLVSKLPTAARCVKLYAVHSSAGNKSGGLALAWTDRELRKYADVDVIFRAHAHTRGFDSVSTVVLETTGVNPAVVEQERYLVSTGHFLNRAGSYAAGKAMAPKPAGTVAVRLSLNRNATSRVQPVYLPTEA